MGYRILGLASGGLSGLSYKHEYLFPALAKKHEVVDVLNTRLSGFPKYWNAVCTFFRLPGISKYLHPFRTISGMDFSYYYGKTIYYALKRVKVCERKIKNLREDYDLIFQTTWQPAIRNKPAKPHFIFEDFTIKMAEREYPQWVKFFTEEEKNKWIKLETETYQNATMIFTVSDHTRNAIINDYGVEEWKVVTTYNGVNIKELPVFEKDYSGKIILFVGIEFERKGGLALINAFKEVKKEIKDVKLVIVGARPHVNIPDVEIKGELNHEMTLQQYKNASIFAMPSICEPFGIAFLEAMAYKTPCIGTTVDAMPEIIEDGKTGFLVPPNDYKQLADKLILLLEDENLMKKMGEEGRKRVEKCFTWDLVVDRMTKHFEEILEG